MFQPRSRKSPQNIFVKTVLPIVERHCHYRWSWLSREQHEEATQEARCHGWRIYLADWRKKATPNSIARFAVSRWHDGRSFVPHRNTDLMGSPIRPARIASLNMLPAEKRVDRRCADPAETVAAKLDYQQLMARLTPMQQTIMMLLMAGYHMTEIADQLRVTVRRVDWVVHHVLPAELIRMFGVEIIPRNYQRHCA